MELPENAFRELGADEHYRPLMHPAHDYKEVTPYSVGVGLLLAVIFSAAAAYLGLRVGQVFEAAIPIAIIAVGMSSALKKNGALGQNVMIQSIGACSGVIVAGAIFTLPSLFILQEVILISPSTSSRYSSAHCLAACSAYYSSYRSENILSWTCTANIPSREATATTQVLASGQGTGAGSRAQARLLVVASLIGGVYDYIVSTFGFWAEEVSTAFCGWGAALAEKCKIVVSCNTGAALLGLGYIVGLKYAFVIFAGSAFVWWVILPLMGTYGAPELTALSPDALFADYARLIGIGGIAMAGVIGIIKSWGIIVQAAGLAGREFKGGKTDRKPLRWQADLSMKHVVFYIVIALVAVFGFFLGGVLHNFWQALVAWVVVTVIAFLFTTVAANAIAIVGTNPVSGMTLMTLIVASAIFVAVGISGTSGIVASMVIGGVVCTALRWPEDLLPT